MGDLGDADGLWNNCAASIRAQVSDAVWRTTFSGAKAVAFDEGELVLVVPNGLQKERIEGRYLGLVQARSTKRLRTTSPFESRSTPTGRPTTLPRSSSRTQISDSPPRYHPGAVDGRTR